MSAVFSDYAMMFSCPICSNVQGHTAGMIPAVITSCRPVAHVICLTCVDTLQSRKKPTETLLCPICRQECGEIVPLSVFVREDLDSVAKKRLELVHAPKSGSIDEVVAQSRRYLESKKIKMVAEKQQLIRYRISHIMHAADMNMQRALKSDEGLWNFWWNEIPAWDTKCSKLDCEPVSRSAVSAELTTMIRELQPHLDKICAGNDFKVTLYDDQSVREGRKSRFVYLKHRIDVQKWIELSGGSVRTNSTPVSTIKRPTPPKRKTPAKKRKRSKKRDDDDDDDDDGDEPELDDDDDEEDEEEEDWFADSAVGLGNNPINQVVKPEEKKSKT